MQSQEEGDLLTDLPARESKRMVAQLFNILLTRRKNS
jgi:hypothetical protein